MFRETLDMLKIGFYISMFFVVLGFVVSLLSAPAGVIEHTVNPSNIVTSYESFYDMKSVFDARTNQILAHKKIVAETDDKSELSRLRIELSGMHQSCREIAGRYNNDSQKLTVGTFKGVSLPQTLNASLCE